MVFLCSNVSHVGGLQRCDDIDFRFATAEAVKKSIADRDNLLKPEDIRKYFLDEGVAELLNKEEGYNKEDFFRLRNHLMLIIQLTNAKRSGVLADFMVKDLKEARKNTKDGELTWTAVVAESKTLKTSGGANVTVDELTYKNLWIYIEMREHYLDPKNDYLFVNSLGQPIDSSDVNRYIGLAYEEVNPNRKITSTCIRKSVVTLSREQLCISRDDHSVMADAMDHSLNTADKNYAVGSRINASVKLVKIINRLFDIPNITQEDSDEDDDMISGVEAEKPLRKRKKAESVSVSQQKKKKVKK